MKPWKPSNAGLRTKLDKDPSKCSDSIRFRFIRLRNDWSAFGNDRSNQTERGCARHPDSWHGPITGCVDQIGAYRWRKTAKDRGSKTVRQRETCGPHLYRHNLCQHDHHSTVVTAVNEREPQLNE